MTSGFSFLFLTLFIVFRDVVVTTQLIVNDTALPKRSRTLFFPSSVFRKQLRIIVNSNLMQKSNAAVRVVDMQRLHTHTHTTKATKFFREID